MKYGAGIVIGPGRSGTRVLDNVVQNNVSGLFLANASATSPALIQHNVFRYNNNDGANGGRGIYTDGEVSGGFLTSVTVDANAFIGNYGGNLTTHCEAAVAFESRVTGHVSQTDLRVTNNVMDDDGKGLLAYNATGLLFQGNTVTHNRDHWSAAVRFEGGMSNVTIRGNNVYDNTGPAVRVDSKGFNGPNSNFTVTGNDFYNNSTFYGTKESLVVGTAQFDGTFDATNNWWGSSTGPGGSGPGTGDLVTTNGNSVAFSPWSTAANTPRPSPYWGLPASPGAVIQAEDFDHGGAGVAYKDADAANTGGQYRLGEGVNVETNSTDGGGYDVAGVKANEWLAYTVNVDRAGTYSVDFRLSNGQGTGGTFHVECDGQNVTGPLTAPATGSWTKWQTFTKAGVSLPAGRHVLKLVFDTNGSAGNVANFNWIRLTNTGAAPAPAAPTALAASAGGYHAVNLAWHSNSTTESGFAIERKTGDAGTWAPVATAAPGATGYTDATVAPGTAYVYRVRAVSPSGDSAESNEASVATPALPAVTYLSDLPWVSATNGWGPSSATRATAATRPATATRSPSTASRTPRASAPTPAARSSTTSAATTPRSSPTSASTTRKAPTARSSSRSTPTA